MLQRSAPNSQLPIPNAQLPTANLNLPSSTRLSERKRQFEKSNWITLSSMNS
jgi:hypothetical protein